MSSIRTSHRLLFALAAAAGGCSATIDQEAPENPPAMQPGPGPMNPMGSKDPGKLPDGLVEQTSQAAACKKAVPLTATPRLVRLTRLQYENTLRDLTGLDVRPSVELPPDPPQNGFNRGLGLEVTERIARIYRDQAEGIALKVTSDEEVFRRVVGCDPAKGEACAKEFIAGFGKRAFRRPLTETEKGDFLKLWKGGDALFETGDAFHKGVRIVVEAMLQSHAFLYRIETSSKRVGDAVPLTSHELASRLSYMITNSMPDPELLAAADRDELKDPQELARHAARLVESPLGRAALHDFLGQWMVVEEYPTKLTKDTKLYPGFGAELAGTLEDEAFKFFEDVTFAQGKGWRTLVTAPFTYVNNVTAPIYKVPGSFGADLKRVELDPAQRAGFLTQVGFLSSHAYPFRSSPIHRGVFVLRKVLCVGIPDPTVQVGQLPPPAEGKTTREIVQEHTADETCRGCHHLLINPVGYGLENYGAVGEWRTKEGSRTIDASGTLAGTKAASSFGGPTEMMRALADAPEARQCYAQSWLRYAYGRQPDQGDACALETLAEKLADDSYTTKDLLVDLAKTKAFMTRTAEGL